MEPKMSDASPQKMSSGDPANEPLKPAPGHRAGMVFGLVIALLVVAVGIFFLVHGKPAQSTGRGGRGGGLGPTMVSTATAQQGDIGIYVNALGAVAPLNMVSVNSRVEGQIVKINYQEGQF